MDEQFMVVEPPKESRPMWEHGGKVYYQETGELASDADVTAFREKHRRLKEEGERLAAEEDKESAAWDAKYIPRMREFWGTDDSVDYDSLGPEDLVYQLSTTLYDKSSPILNKATPSACHVSRTLYDQASSSEGRLPPGKSCYMDYAREVFAALTKRIRETRESELSIEGLELGEDMAEFKECLEEMKRLFPEYWKDALVGFGNGHHDT